MTREELVASIRKKRSLLCVGLDTEAHLLPEHFLQERHPMRSFNQAIIEVTHDLAVAYKLNLAFYEAQGEEGWLDLESTITYIRSKSNCFIIADAKRGDIGNTARKYAEAFFDRLDVDAITLSPYMGRDSVMPFLGRKGKWAIVLGVTSNPGAEDIQTLQVKVRGERRLYEVVMEKIAGWGTPKELMFVVGATRPAILAEVRALVPDHFFLVPGVGAQGGDLEQVMEAGLTTDGGLLINSSRAILYAGKNEDAIPAARRAALELRREMSAIMEARGVL
jgi:orotidine-5'-phosphate decarboxylase